MDKSTVPRYFISGHTDLDVQEWDAHYAPAIAAVLNEYQNCAFVLGHARGTDTMALDYLLAHLGVDPSRITVFFPSKNPIKKGRLSPNQQKVTVRFGFANVNERDAALTRNSTHDIAWVRPEEQQRLKLGPKYDPKRISGTAANLLRRRDLETTSKVEIKPVESNTVNTGFQWNEFVISPSSDHSPVVAVSTDTKTLIFSTVPQYFDNIQPVASLVYGYLFSRTTFRWTQFYLACIHDNVDQMWCMYWIHQYVQVTKLPDVPESEQKYINDETLCPNPEMYLASCFRRRHYSTCQLIREMFTLATFDDLVYREQLYDAQDATLIVSMHSEANFDGLINEHFLERDQSAFLTVPQFLEGYRKSRATSVDPDSLLRSILLYQAVDVLYFLLSHPDVLPPFSDIDAVVKKSVGDKNRPKLQLMLALLSEYRGGMQRLLVDRKCLGTRNAFGHPNGRQVPCTKSAMQDSQYCKDCIKAKQQDQSLNSPKPTCAFERYRGNRHRKEAKTLDDCFTRDCKSTHLAAGTPFCTRHHRPSKADYCPRLLKKRKCGRETMPGRDICEKCYTRMRARFAGQSATAVLDK